MKVDLVMWAKNSEKFLSQVLKRVEQVIPHENINRRIFVDDSSVDRTIFIARDFNWEVHPNREGFIRGGFLEAFRHTEMPFVVSIEHDVLLDRRWWDRIPPCMEDHHVAVANGLCLFTLPTLRTIQMHQLRKYPAEIGLSNTIYRTKIIKGIGLPKYITTSVDLELNKILRRLGYKWIVDSSVHSDHIRFSVLEHFLHVRRLLKLSNEIQSIDVRNPLGLALETLLSPLAGLKIALGTKRPQVMPVYVVYTLIAMEMHLVRRQAKKFDRSIDRIEICGECMQEL